MNTLATSLLFGCIGVVLAWLARRPVRRVAGVGPAFCLWVLPPLLAAAAWLPAWSVGPAHGVAFIALPTLISAASAAATAGDAGVNVAHLLLVLWLVGAGLMLARLAVHCLGIVRRARPLPAALRTSLAAELDGLDPRVIRLHRAGPAVCWLPRCHLLLPADMLERFDHEQRVQVLAHERMHLARRDPAWSLIAELMLAALWFFPLAWWAMDRFHLDQELACDAAILERAPQQAGAYARALLSGTAPPRSPVPTTAWLSHSQLKERLTMIHQHPHAPLNRRIGYALLVILLGGTALAAQAALPASGGATAQPERANATRGGAPISLAIAWTTPQSAAQPMPASPVYVNPSFAAKPLPHYPPTAVKKHEEGTVPLLILVGTDGQPMQIQVEPTDASQSLIAAAKNAAAKWRFNPMRRDGKPIRAWARVPVVFNLPQAPQSAASAAKPHVDRAYRLQHRPRYPPSAIKHHQQGTVVLRVLVDQRGRAAKVKVAHGVTPALDRAAVNAAKGWRFNPGMRDGKPYAAWIRLPVTFSLHVPKLIKDTQPNGSANH